MNLKPEEIQRAISHLPPVLKVDQVVQLLQVPKKTVYEWSSAGRFALCARRRGKHLLFYRDKLIEEIFNGKDW